MRSRNPYLTWFDLKTFLLKCWHSSALWPTVRKKTFQVFLLTCLQVICELQILSTQVCMLIQVWSAEWDGGAIGRFVWSRCRGDSRAVVALYSSIRRRSHDLRCLRWHHTRGSKLVCYCCPRGIDGVYCFRLSFFSLLARWLMNRCTMQFCMNMKPREFQGHRSNVKVTWPDFRFFHRCEIGQKTFC